MTALRQILNRIGARSAAQTALTKFAYLSGLHRVQEVHGAHFEGGYTAQDLVWAQVKAKRTGLDRWTFECDGSSDYKKVIATGLPLREALQRMDQFEQALWRERAPEGGMRFNVASGRRSWFYPQVRDLESMKQVTGLRRLQSV